jgi:c(7)-type cytochrome triheme protein
MLLWAAVCITAVGCSRRLASVVLDVPPEPVDTAQTVALDSALLRLLAQQQGQAAPDTVRPEIEQLLDPDTVKALLPKDHAGNVDWMEALRQGVIDPRHGPPGQDAPPPEGAFRFGFDFYLPGPDTTLNAFFPHSAHTEWVDCAQCHPRIFPVRGTAITMGDVFQGKYCGECHGKVAFPVLTGCERCHTKLPPMPAGRAKPDLIGTITLARVDRSSGAAAEAPESAPGTPTGAPTPTDASTAVDSTAAPDTAAAQPEAPANTRSFVTASLPPAQFPHWVHRIRYRCKTCHMQIFEPRQGANRITMADIGAGQACGVCHDGQTAFASGFGECERCHVAPTPPAAANPDR